MGVLYKSIKRGQITKEDAFARELERDEGRSSLSTCQLAMTFSL